MVSIKNIPEFYRNYRFIKYFFGNYLPNIIISTLKNIYITHSIMANIISRVHKVVKQNIKRPDITTNIVIVPVSILSQHK